MIVTVKIRRVKQVDGPDGGWTAGDYYAKVWIGSSDSDLGRAIPKKLLESPNLKNKKDASPNWTFASGVVVPGSTIPIHIELWDADIGSADDEIDISATNGKRALDLTYDLSTGSISGDGGLTGTGGSEIVSKGIGDKPRGEIWFTIEAPAEVLACDVPIKVTWLALSNRLGKVEAGLRGLNDRLYNCTDGQWRVGRFLIHGGGSTADDNVPGIGHIHRSGTHGGLGYSSGRPGAPKLWHLDEDAGAGTYLMEFLHSWTGLKDEYEVSEGGASRNCPETKALRDATNACVMDRTTGTTEFCRPETHNKDTEQGHVNGMDCYSWVRKVMNDAQWPNFQVPKFPMIGPTSAPPLRFVYFTIRRVNQMGNPRAPGFTPARYHVRVQMDGLSFAPSVTKGVGRGLLRNTVIRPLWLFGFAFSHDADRTIPIRIELWNEASGSEVECDINQTQSSKKYIELTYDTSTGEIAGDVTVTKKVLFTARGSGANSAQIKGVFLQRGPND